VIYLLNLNAEVYVWKLKKAYLLIMLLACAFHLQPTCCLGSHDRFKENVLSFQQYNYFW